MLAIDRLNAIKQMLAEQESVTVNDLVQQLDVTAETVRRDLERLSKEDDRVVRVHGGAFLRPMFRDTPYEYRQNALLDEKRQIAKAALRSVRDGESMMLDNSTTTLCFAKLIKESGLRLSVITNSLDIVNELRDCSNIKLICVGGSYQANSCSFTGIMTIRELENFHTDSAFISCSGLHHEFGLTDVSENTSQIRATMLSNASRKFLLADHTKFGRSKTNKIAPLDALDAVFTNVCPPELWLKTFEEKGIGCFYDE